MKRMNHLSRVIIYDINLGFNSNLTDGKQLVEIKTNMGTRKDDLLQGCGLAGEMHTAVTPWTPGQAGRDRFHCIGSGHWVQQRREAADWLTTNEASQGDDGFLMLILNWKKRHQLGVVSDRSSPGYLGLTDPGLKPGILDGARVLCEMDWSQPVCVSRLPTLCLTLQINSVLLVWTLWVLRQKICSVSSEVSTLKDTRCSLFLPFPPPLSFF